MLRRFLVGVGHCGFERGLVFELKELNSKSCELDWVIFVS